jgi:hypothetical protein
LALPVRAPVVEFIVNPPLGDTLKTPPPAPDTTGVIVVVFDLHMKYGYCIAVGVVEIKLIFKLLDVPLPQTFNGVTVNNPELAFTEKLILFVGVVVIAGKFAPVPEYVHAYDVAGKTTGML